MLPNCDNDAGCHHVFTGPALRVTVACSGIEIARTGLLARLRGGVRTIPRQTVLEARVLPWGGALLLITEDRVHTLDLGPQSPLAREAILAPPCPRCATLTTPRT